MAKTAEELERVYTRILRGLSQLPAEVGEFLFKFVRESARGAVLVVGAYADVHVEDLLRKAFRPGRATDWLLDPKNNGPLASFWPRVQTCWSLGLIDDDEHKNLKLIRDLRNYCAHNVDAIDDFNNPTVRGYISSLKTSRDPDGDMPPNIKLGLVLADLRKWSADPNAPPPDADELRLMVADAVAQKLAQELRAANSDAARVEEDDGGDAP